jgi:chromosome partitioning protein
LTINALAVAHEVLIPMQPHFLALQGVAKLLETVRLVNQRMNPQLKVTGVVLTMYDAQTKLSSEVVAELHGFIEQAQGKPLPWAGAKVFDTKIRRNIKLAECPSFGQTIMKYDAASNGAFDYRNLARELLGLAPIVQKVVSAKPQAAAAVATPAPVSAPAPIATPTPVPSVSVTVNPAIVAPPKPTTSRVAATPKVPRAPKPAVPTPPAVKATVSAPAASPSPAPQQQEVA